MAGKKKAAPPPDKLMTELARRGPHKVDRGDLGIVGMSGQIFVPRTGRKLPAVAFGHDWLAAGARYRDLAFHLASWGIVVALPDGQTGMFASDVELATDLRAAVTVLQSVQLGDGSVSVDPDRIAVAGHGFGAAAAIRAASDATLLGRPPVGPRSLVTVFPSPTTADLLPAAATVTARSLVLGAGGMIDTMTSNALDVAENLGGDVVFRTIAAADNRGLLEKRSLASFVGVNGADKATHRPVRAQLAGYLLHTLTDDRRYEAFADPEVSMGDAHATSIDDADHAELDHLSLLLGAKPPRK